MNPCFSPYRKNINLTFLFMLGFMFLAVHLSIYGLCLYIYLSATWYKLIYTDVPKCHHNSFIRGLWLLTNFSAWLAFCDLHYKFRRLFCRHQYKWTKLRSDSNFSLLIESNCFQKLSYLYISSFFNYSFRMSFKADAFLYP